MDLAASKGCLAALVISRARRLQHEQRRPAALRFEDPSYRRDVRFWNRAGMLLQLFQAPHAILRHGYRAILHALNHCIEPCQPLLPGFGVCVQVRQVDFSYVSQNRIQVLG